MLALFILLPVFAFAQGGSCVLFIEASDEPGKVGETTTFLVGGQWGEYDCGCSHEEWTYSWAVRVISSDRRYYGSSESMTVSWLSGDQGMAKVDVVVTCPNGYEVYRNFTNYEIVGVSAPTPPSGTVTATNLNECNLYSFGVSGTLCGSGSYTYKWNFGDGSPVSNSSSPQHPFFQKGTYTVAVEVTGSCGTSTFNKVITVQ